jgi:MFS family permease
VPRLVRDRVTWLIYAQLGAWGYFLYGFGPVIPLLRREQATGVAVASLHSTGLAVGALLGGALFPPLVRRLGRGRVLWWSLGVVVVATAAFCAFRPLGATLASAVAAATAGTIVVNGVVAALSEHHGAAASAAISEANAVAAGMGVLAPLVIGLSVRAGLGWRPAMLALAGLIAALAVVARILRVRVPVGSGFVGRPSGVAAPAAAPSAAAPSAAAPGGSSDRLPPPYWIAWALMGVTGSVEVCLSLWAAEELRTNVGMSAGGASAGVASIVIGMFVGRLVGGRVALRLAPVPLLLGALGLSAAGFALFWLSTVGWLAVGGLLVLGLGNAMHYPLAISMAVAAGGNQPDKAAAYSSYSIALGFGLGPLALGAVADGLGSPHRAFLLVPALLAVAAALAVRLGRRLAAPLAAGVDLAAARE